MRTLQGKMQRCNVRLAIYFVVDVFLPIVLCDYRELMETRHLERDGFVSLSATASKILVYRTLYN